MQRKKQVFSQAGIWMFRNLNMAIVVIPAGHCNFSNTFWALAQKKAWAYFSTFWQETFLHRHFIDIYISAHGHFDSMDYLARELFRTRTFRHRDISAPGYFGMGTFWHRDISALKHFGTWIFRQSNTFLHRCPKSLFLIVHIALYGAKMSMSG